MCNIFCSFCSFCVSHLSATKIYGKDYFRPGPESLPSYNHNLIFFPGYSFLLLFCQPFVSRTFIFGPDLGQNQLVTTQNRETSDHTCLV